MDLLRTANQHILAITPYQAGKSIEAVQREFNLENIIKLASNENPLGMSPKAQAAAAACLQQLHIYPDASYYRLRLAIAKYNGISIDKVIVGNGSENCMDFLLKAFVNNLTEVIVDQYCFATIPILINSYGAKLVRIPPLANFCHNIERMVDGINSRTRMIFVINPSNPLGTYVSTEQLLMLLDNTPADVIVVVDEAYYEYVDNDDYPQTLQLLDQYPNLVISRSFSKVFGLAGLRLGYLMASQEIIDLLNRSRLPFNVSSMAVEAGIAALSDDEFLLQTKFVNNNGLLQLAAGLAEAHIKYIPSVANFITIDTQTNALAIFEQLLQRGVIVRPLRQYALPQHLRITVGTKEENDKFLTAIKQII